MRAVFMRMMNRAVNVMNAVLRMTNRTSKVMIAAWRVMNGSWGGNSDGGAATSFRVFEREWRDGLDGVESELMAEGV